MIARLTEGPASVTELAGPSEMGLPSFPKHVKVLENCGLINSEKSGRVRICHLMPKRLAAAESWLSEQHAIWKGWTDRLAAFVEKRYMSETNNNDGNRTLRIQTYQGSTLRSLAGMGEPQAIRAMVDCRSNGVPCREDGLRTRRRF